MIAVQVLAEHAKPLRALDPSMAWVSAVGCQHTTWMRSVHLQEIRRTFSRPFFDKCNSHTNPLPAASTVYLLALLGAGHRLGHGRPRTTGGQGLLGTIVCCHASSFWITTTPKWP